MGIEKNREDSMNFANNFLLTNIYLEKVSIYIYFYGKVNILHLACK